ncbi:MAG: 50S ribosomal protein L3, partial [Clostridiales bacterium]|nr:50S ribosomal protein L3 [Clostridiales bacterium]
MKKFILGRKIGMTQIFDETGIAIPVTVVEAGPCMVIQKKTVETDGYESVKIGFGETAERKLTKPVLGMLKKAGVPPLKHIREFRASDVGAFEVGQAISVEEMFSAGDRVDVSGISKGKGFQGAIKRHGQHRGPETHGSKSHRVIGSMGANSYPGRVFKGKKMPGHMGNDRITVQNLDIVKVDGELNMLLV